MLLAFISPNKLNQLHWNISIKWIKINFQVIDDDLREQYLIILFLLLHLLQLDNLSQTLVSTYTCCKEGKAATTFRASEMILFHLEPNCINYFTRLETLCPSSNHCVALLYKAVRVARQSVTQKKAKVNWPVIEEFVFKVILKLAALISFCFSFSSLLSVACQKLKAEKYTL